MVETGVEMVLLKKTAEETVEARVLVMTTEVEMEVARMVVEKLKVMDKQDVELG